MAIAIGLGKSLWPFIRSQSILQFESIPASGVHIGDLILYCGAKKPICHRVLLKKKEDETLWFFLKGDGNLHSDGWIPDYRLMGRVTHVDGRPVQRRRQCLFAFLHLAYARAQILWAKLQHA